jgi:hypothetical protein
VRRGPAHKIIATFDVAREQSKSIVAAVGRMVELLHSETGAAAYRRHRQGDRGAGAEKLGDVPACVDALKSLARPRADISDATLEIEGFNG